MLHYLKLALPSMLFLGMEGAAFNGTSMVAAFLGPVQCAAWTILLQLQAFGWSTTYGTTTGVGVRIGNALGGLMPKQAQRYGNASIFLVCGLSTFNSLIFLTFMGGIMSIFTDDKFILEEMKSIAVYVPIMHIRDCVQFVFQGIYAGAGMNKIGAPILLFFLWGIGLPLSCVLSITYKWGILGILIGMSFAMVIEIPVFIFIMKRRFDWKELAAKAANRSQVGDDDEIDIFAGGLVVRGAAVEISTSDIVSSMQEINIFALNAKKEHDDLIKRYEERIEGLQQQVASHEAQIQELHRLIASSSSAVSIPY